MKLDIKIPIGLMFTIFGLILTIYGLATGNDAGFYTKSLGSNVNLWTGIIMLVFGIMMLLLSWKTKKEANKS
jgi:formate hydrogenlyase subunit 3/multisubunit Na+/H+ antiporter MnhD subunit